MKQNQNRPQSLVFLKLFAVMFALVTGAAQAANLFWSANGTTQGGAGTWDTSNARWGAAAGGPFSTTWNNTGNAADTAIFGGTAGSVTVGTISAGAITFTTDGYTLATGPLTLGLAGGTITTGSGSDTISAVISGTVGLTKQGSGVLALSGNNTFSGGLAVNAGTVQLSTPQSFTGGVTLNGATLLGSAGGGLAGAALGNNNLTNSGASQIRTLANETINGGIAINASSTLDFGPTAAGATTVSGPVTGSGVLDCRAGGLNGAVTINLNSTANTFTGNVVASNNVASPLSFNFASLGDGGKIFIDVGNTQNKTYTFTGANAGLTWNSRQIVFVGNNSAGLKIVNSTAFPFAINSDIDASGATGTRTLTLGGAGAGLSTFGGLLSNGGLTSLAIAKADSGTWVFTNANTYSGGTTVSAGILVANNSAALGTGTLTLNNGTLSNNVSGITLTNPVTLTSAGTVAVPSGSTLTLGGALSSSGSFTKSGAGSLTLTNTSSYNGATAVNGGTLTLVNGGNLGATAVTVGSGATLAVTQNANSTANTASTSSLTLNAGSALNMADGFTSQLNVTGTATLAPASGAGVVSPVLSFEIIGTAADKLAISGAATVGTAGAKVNIPSLTSAITPATYTLITAASGLGANISLVNTVLPNATGLYTLTPTLAAGSYQVGVAADANALYYKGGSGNVGNKSNFTTDQAGTVSAGSGGYTDNTFNLAFNAQGASPLTPIVAAAAFPKSVNFLSGASSVTIGAGASALTIGSGGINDASANDMTISSGLTLGAVQTWINQGAGLLTISGAVTNGANNLTLDGTGNTTISGAIGNGAGTLTKNGTGTLTLTGGNNYTGTTTINAGTVKIGNATALGTTAGNTTIASGATLDLNGQTITEPFGTIAGTGVGGNGALINTSSTIATNTGTISAGSTSFSIGGTGDIKLNVTSGTGNWTLTKVGNNTLTLGDGATATDNGFLILAVNSGTVILNKPGGLTIHAVGGASSVASGATLQLGSGGNDYPFYGNTATTVNSGGVYDLNGKNDNRSSAAGGTINLNGTGINNGGALINSAAATTSILSSLTGGVVLQSPSSIGGAGNITISNAISGASQSLTKVGAGTLTLQGTNTYTGPTTVSAGTLTIGSTGLLNTNSSVTVNNGATFTFARSDTWGNASNSTASSPITINSGGAVTSGGNFNTIWNLNLNGGTLSSAGGVSSTFGTFGLAGTVTNAAGVTSLITNGTGNNNFINLGNGISASSTTFNVGAGGTLNIGTVLQDHSYFSGGNFTVAANLIKTGTGTLTLFATNTYSGGTTISNGTLALGANGVLRSTGSVTISGGTLDAQTFANTNGTLNVTAAGAINIGSGGTLTFADSSSVNSGNWAGTLSITGSFVSGSSLRFGTTSSGLTAAQLTKISLPGGAPAALNSSGYLTAAVIAPNLTYSVGAGAGQRILVSDLITSNGVYSSQGSPSWTIVTAGPTSTQGGTVSNGTSQMQYTAPNSTINSDTFTYTLSDGVNTSAAATVTINFVQQSGGNANITVSGNTANATLFGIPGQNYGIQRSTNGVNGPYYLLSSPPLTNTVLPITAAGDGSVKFSDTNIIYPSAFYRLIQQ